MFAKTPFVETRSAHWQLLAACADLLRRSRPTIALLFALAVPATLPLAHAGPPIALASEQTRIGLQGAIATYQALVERGGWGVIPSGRRIEPGDRDARLPALRQRLRLTGDYALAEAPQADLYDTDLEAAVRRFQRRHGLLPDGLIGPNTIEALNVPAAERLAQLHDSLRRTTALSKTAPAGRYVMVNIPAFELQAVRDGNVELDSVVVIGRRDRQTPEINARLTAVNFHPTWHVPASIVRKDLFPRLVADPEHFVRQDYRIIRNRDGAEIAPADVARLGLRPHEIRMIRKPGPHNPLGRIRLDMPNNQAIYLHDSPASALYMRADRSFSAGCIRVARVVELSAWLLGQTLDQESSPITQALQRKEASTMRLPEPVPVHMVYVTAWVDSDAVVQFREDVYHLGWGDPNAAGA